MMNTKTAIRTSEQIVSTVSALTNHVASQVTRVTSDLSSNTLKGIKQYFKFTAHKQKNWIYAYSDSVQTEYEHRYLPREVVGLTDIELHQ